MRATAGVLLLAAVAVLAACSGPASSSSSDGPTLTGSATPTIGPSAIGTTAAIPADLPTDIVAYVRAGGSPVTLQAYADPSSDYHGGFETPSGNITCGFDLTGPYVGCGVRENSWPPIPDPLCPGGDWLPTYVSAGPEQVTRGTCAGGQVYPIPATVLPYGSVISNGSIACRSESAFVACANLATGNGFAIAREFYQPYGTVVPYPTAFDND